MEASERPTVKIGVAVSDSLPPDVFHAVRAIFRDLPIEPFVYYRIPKPINEIVTGTYVEARNNFFASQAIFLALSRDSAGHLIDHWTLPLLAEFRSHQIPIYAYVARTAVPSTSSIPIAILTDAHVQVKLLSSFDDVAPGISADVDTLFFAR